MSGREVVVLMEEAHLHLSDENISRSGGEPLAVRLLRMGRKHGVYAIVVDQTPSELPGAVLANLASKMVMRLTSAACARAMSVSMGLSREQHDELVKLPRRMAVVQSADFLFLQNQLDMTPDNLSSHLSKLEDAGYVEIVKEFIERKPHTALKLTEQGRKAFKEYQQNLKQIFSNLPE